MIYQGNKARLRKYIVPFIQNCIDRNNIKTYIEPFVGGANVIDHIRCSERIGTDINRELITLLNYMKYYPDMAIFPEECPFKLYNNVREARKKTYREIQSGVYGRNRVFCLLRREILRRRIWQG